jgi:predicted DNA-binding transcriptional regulator AlpA
MSKMSQWTQPNVPGRVIIRRRELKKRVSYTMTHVWRLEKRDPPEFPVRVQIGPRSVGWYEDEVDAWINSRVRGFSKRSPPVGPPEPPADPPTPRLRRRAPVPRGTEAAD